MKKWIVFGLLQVALIAGAQEQPTNFMIAEFTFVRPAAWKWIDQNQPNERARLLIIDDILHEKAIVSFELVTANPVPSFADKWTEPYLSQDRAPMVRFGTNRVAHYRVITIDISGTKVVNKQPSTNQATHGVVVELNGQELGARILGSKPMVDKLKPVFAQVIKNALKPEE
jgi:hypothetical protein